MCKGKVDEVRDEGVKLSEMGNSWKILSKGFYIFFIPSYYVLTLLFSQYLWIDFSGSLGENADLKS